MDLEETLNRIKILENKSQEIRDIKSRIEGQIQAIQASTEDQDLDYLIDLLSTRVEEDSKSLQSKLELLESKWI